MRCGPTALGINFLYFGVAVHSEFYVFAKSCGQSTNITLAFLRTAFCERICREL